MAPSSTTTAARAPSRNSASIWLRESGVTFSELFASPETASVIDGPRSCLVFWLDTGVAGDDRQTASYEQPPSRLLAARGSQCFAHGIMQSTAASRFKAKGIKIW